MKSEITALRVGAFVFALVFLVHLARLMMHFPIIIGAYMVPLWMSVIGLIVAGILCYWMWRLSHSLAH